MAIIFVDFDGTVVDATERLYRAYSRALSELGLPCLRREEYRSRKRRGEPEREVTGLGSDELFARYAERRRALLEAPELLGQDAVLPGAAEALGELAAAHRLVLVSLRSSEEALIGQMGRLGLSRWFQAVRTGRADGLPGWQAKARLCREERWTGEALIVGDTEDEVLAGRSLGMPAVAVLSGLRGRRFLTALGPTAVLESIAGLPRWLASMRPADGPSGPWRWRR